MLKVGSPQPSAPSTELPPLGQGDIPPTDGAQEPPMMGDMPQGDMPMDGGGEDLDGNFDAGVDADEEQDPKKYIQQLSGKLSQSLRKYNNNLPQPDADLNKYVAGMIVKQAVNGMSEEDVNDILNKLKTDEDDDGGSGDDVAPQDGTDDGNVPQNSEGVNEPLSEMVSNKELIDELFQDIVNNQSDKQVHQDVQYKGYRTKPFRSRKFK